MKQENSVQDLIEYAVEHEGAQLTQGGGLAVFTGRRTGRSTSDRYIVKDSQTEALVNWGGFNQPYCPQRMAKVWDIARGYSAGKLLFKHNWTVGANASYALRVCAETEYAWHQLFLHNLFIQDRNTQTESRLGLDASWSLVSLPGLELDSEDLGLNSSAGLFVDFTQKRVLLCGLRYAGEMKKAFFSVLNFLLPRHDVLPMHCAANEGVDGDVSLFFGLSGTGKTSLSSDVNRRLIGDDEHGWSNNSVFNFEGGCYAKCINLSEEKEPLIWKASRSAQTVLENVHIGSNGHPDFDDCSTTKNTRAAYSRSVLDNCVADNQGSCPKRVVFLTCDLYGVLPPVAALSVEQARFWFLNGYTAMIANTLYDKNAVQSDSVSQIKPTFSACFGQAFFPLHPNVYADLLEKRLQESSAQVYLVNTGWHSGAHMKGGTRFDIALTRRIIDHIHAGSIERAEKVVLEGFGLCIPKTLQGIADHLLNPEHAWSDKNDYKRVLAHLYTLCESNYEQYIESVVEA